MEKSIRKRVLATLEVEWQAAGRAVWVKVKVVCSAAVLLDTFVGDIICEGFKDKDQTWLQNT